MNKFILLIALISISAAFAQTASQKALIRKNVRPTSEQIMSNPENLKKFGEPSFNSTAYDTHLPQLIVALEKAFPGGTYGFLGRDMDLIADAVEAYYLSIGQKGRVKHIRFSTPSMQGATAELVAGLLREQGLNTKKGPYNGPEFVMVDYTSFGSGSQSTTITQLVIDYMKSQGLSGTDIIRRFNVMSIGNPSAGTFNPLSSNETALAFKKRQAQQIQSQGGLREITVANAGGSSMAYTSEWHDRYGSIKKEGGRFVTKPESFNTVEEKEAVLSEMIEAIKFASSAKFRASVQSVAKANKVTFVKPDPSKIVAIPEANPNQEYLERVQALKELPKRGEEEKTVKVKLEGDKIRLSSNGTKVLEILNDSSYFEASAYLEVSLQTLVTLYEEGKIGVRDFRRILIIVLNNSTNVSPTFLKMAEYYYKRSYPLEIFLGRDFERSQYSTLNNNAGLNYKNLISKPFANKPSCRFSYADIEAR